MTTQTKKLKLLVTGASGFIGYEVSRQLSRDGYRPRLMIRQPGDDCEICRFDAEIALADLRHPDCLRQAVKGVDGIIHLGARATFESYATLKPSILDGSTALMEAGIEAGVRRFVYSSSLLVTAARHPWLPPIPRSNRCSGLWPHQGGHGKALVGDGRLGGCGVYSPAVATRVRSSRSLFPPAASRSSRSAGAWQKRLHAPSRRRCGRGHHRLYGAILFRHPAPRRSSAIDVGYLPGRCQATFPERPRARVSPMVGPAGHGPADALSTHSPNPGLETPGAVRSYNFNLAVDPDLLWRDIGLTPRYGTIREGIPRRLPPKPDTAILTTRLG